MHVSIIISSVGFFEQFFWSIIVVDHIATLIFIFTASKNDWNVCLIRTELHLRATQRITGVERNVLSNSHHLIKYALFCIWPPFICVTSGSKGQLHKWPTQFFFRFIIKFHVCVRCPHTKLNGEKRATAARTELMVHQIMFVCVCVVWVRSILAVAEWTMTNNYLHTRWFWILSNDRRHTHTRNKVLLQRHGTHPNQFNCHLLCMCVLFVAILCKHMNSNK